MSNHRKINPIGLIDMDVELNALLTDDGERATADVSRILLAGLADEMRIDLNRKSSGARVRVPEGDMLTADLHELRSELEACYENLLDRLLLR